MSKENAALALLGLKDQSSTQKSTKISACGGGGMYRLFESVDSWPGMGSGWASSLRGRDRSLLNRGKWWGQRPWGGRSWVRWDVRRRKASGLTPMAQGWGRECCMDMAGEDLGLVLQGAPPPGCSAQTHSLFLFSTVAKIYVVSLYFCFSAVSEQMEGYLHLTIH